MTPDITARIDALADAVLGDRADRHLLRPALVSTLRIEVTDFEKYHPAELAALRLRDAAILRQDPRFAKTTGAGR